MSKSIQVSISILCADFSSLANEIKKIEKSGADMIHVDVMDGHFVPPITIGAMIVKAIRPLTKLPIDSHLMVEHPENLFEDFAQAGADSLSIHAECYGEWKEECRDFGSYPKELERFDAGRAKRDIAQIQKLGMKAFMVINPSTEAGVLDPVLPELDGVLVMSVNPGFAFQKFMPNALPKLQYFREHFQGSIAIDGGINDLTGAEAVKAGADILATASFFFQSEDPQACVRKLKSSSP